MAELGLGIPGEGSDTGSGTVKPAVPITSPTWAPSPDDYGC